MSSATASPTLAELPLRPELVGQIPYGAPQLDVPVCLNVNENPYPPSAEVISDIAAAVADAAGTMNRYPERDALELRADLARYLGHDLAAEQIWAANGSNEVMLHVLLAFAGPGRMVLSFAPTYSMYPEYARDTHSGWLTFPRQDDFRIDQAAAVAAVREVRPDVVLISSPNNPTGTAVDLGVPAAGYEIHHGRTRASGGAPVLASDGGDPGCRSGAVVGIAWHGVFEGDEFRRAFLGWVAAERGLDWLPGEQPFAVVRERQLDALGDLIAEHADTSALRRLIERGVPAGLPVVPPGDGS
jgi:Aminotransferase class I and II